MACIFEQGPPEDKSGLIQCDVKTCIVQRNALGDGWVEESYTLDDCEEVRNVGGWEAWVALIRGQNNSYNETPDL